MARTPFKMRSGNTSAFKNLGSSPVKKIKSWDTGIKDPDTGQNLDYLHDRSHPTVQEERFYNYATDFGRRSLQSDQPDQPATSGAYSEAYKLADKSKYKSETEFTKAAKKWNMDTYGTHSPTAEANKQGITKPELAAKWNDLRKKYKWSVAQATQISSENVEEITDEQALAASRQDVKAGLESGKYKPRPTQWDPNAVEVVRPTVKPKRRIGVEEAKGRGTDRVKAARKIFGKGSPEVKTAKKARKASIKKAKSLSPKKEKTGETEAIESTTYKPRPYTPRFVHGSGWKSLKEIDATMNQFNKHYQ